MATTSIGAPGVTFPDATVQASAVTGNNGMIVGVAPGTWTKNAGLKSIKVTVVGGGGGGSGFSGSKGGNGGAAGGAAIRFYPAPSIPGPQPYTVGGAGATSSFGVAPITVVSATGGASSTGQTSPLVGAGGQGSNGNINFRGGSGSNGAEGSPASPLPGTVANAGGVGGSSIFGANGGGGGQKNGGDYGGGGGGGSTSSPAGSSGGTGGPGVVIIEEFY
jgi:hypothetical protein